MLSGNVEWMTGGSPAARLADAAMRKIDEGRILTLDEKLEVYKIIRTIRSSGTAGRASKILLSKARRYRFTLTGLERALLMVVRRMDPKLSGGLLLHELAGIAERIILAAARRARRNVKRAIAYVAAALKIGMRRAISWLADPTYLEWAQHAPCHICPSPG